MNETLTYSYPLHNHFFIVYIVVGSVLGIMNIQVVLVIRRHKSLWKLSAYRFLLFASAVDAANCAAQVTVVALTFRTPDIDYTINLILGAIFQTTYAMEYPVIFVLAINRFTAVIMPHKLDRLFTMNITLVLIVFCVLFGGFNCAICFSGHIQSLWDPLFPTFYFTGQTNFVAVFMRSMDFYLSEVVVCSSLFIYLVIVFYIVFKRRLIGTTRAELPLLLHSFQFFMFSGVMLYFWYNPISTTQLYTHVFNVLVVIRFGFAPVSLLLINKTIRTHFFRLSSRSSHTTSVVGNWFRQATVQDGGHSAFELSHKSATKH
ncbi:hypothetical protein Y032_0069g365 [Ancylostoma ceylanicum]|nr:hypothetical protein Y032_0069g365 [Ancylostoma ceylanicum]